MKNSFAEEVEKNRIRNVHLIMERMLKKKEKQILKGKILQIRCMYCTYHRFCKYCKGSGELKIDWVSYLTGRWY
jgi:hypothetical protein